MCFLQRLLDIGPPYVNGYELAGMLRTMPAIEGLRLIAVTGYGQAEDHERTRTAQHQNRPISSSLD